jgi:hypothetical protein
LPPSTPAIIIGRKKMVFSYIKEIKSFKLTSQKMVNEINGWFNNNARENRA